ncbi:MAG: stage II sporulation protein M [Candidatus Altiarchaeota archaeon]|nr:stage II sporulation protein M [Candidatus Altiarchaeota archaeon]
MVLESIIIPAEMERHPNRMFYVGFIYASVGLLLGFLVFGKYASLSSIFLTSMPLIVILYKAINLEEHKEMAIHSEFSLMKEHKHILSFFISLFLGMVIAYAIWFSVLPSSIVERLFDTQMETINSLTGGDINVTGAATGGLPALETILFNNLRVWFFCILFSFIYGGGSIFILTWNASVIGVAAGNVFREVVSKYSQAESHKLLSVYFAAVPVSLSYLVHGIPEIAAYFLGALGGGIISVAVIKHDIRSKNFRHVLTDSLDLLAVSLAVLIIAALVEVYITPMAL